MHELLEQVLGFVRHVWRGRWLALAIAWLVCLVGWAVVSMIPDKYESSARVYADTESLLGPLMPGIAVTRNLESQLSLFEQTMLSGPNVDKIIAAAGLLPPGASLESAEARAASKAIRTGMQIEVEKRNFFGIRYEDRDPIAARKVVEGLLEVFTGTGVGPSQDDLQQAASFLEEQIAPAKAGLSDAEAALTRFQEENSDLVGAADRFFIRMQNARNAVTQLRGEVALVRAERDELERQLRSTPATLVPTGPTGALLQTGRQAELSALRTRLVELQGKYTPQHPDVVATSRAIARLEADLDANPQSRPSGPSNPTYERLRLQLAQARANAVRVESELEQAELQAEELRNKATVVPEAEAEFRSLTREYEHAKRNYEQIIQQRDSARIAGAFDARTNQVDFRVIEPASAPERPSSPNRLMLLGAVFVIGLGAGAAVALIIGLINAPFDNPRALHAAFDLRVLGTVSRLRRHRDRSQAIASTAAFAVGCVLLLVLLAGILAAERSSLVQPLRSDAQEILQEVAIA